MLWVSTCRILIWDQKIQKTLGSRYALALNEHFCDFLQISATYALTNFRIVYFGGGSLIKPILRPIWGWGTRLRSKK